MSGGLAAVPINLEVLDTPIIQQTNFGPDQDRWITNIVDIINASFSTISNSVNNLISAAGIDIGGMGAGPITVNVTGLVSSGSVNATIVSTSNPNITILSAIPGLNSFSLTFSGDPGASAVIYYQAFSSQP